MSKLEHMKSLYRIHGSIGRLFDLGAGTPADKLYDVVMNEMDIEETLSDEETEAVNAFCVGLNEADDAERAKNKPLQALIRLVSERGQAAPSNADFGMDKAALSAEIAQDGSDGVLVIIAHVVHRVDLGMPERLHATLYESSAGRLHTIMPASPVVIESMVSAWTVAVADICRGLGCASGSPRDRRWGDVALRLQAMEVGS